MWPQVINLSVIKKSCKQLSFYRLKTKALLAVTCTIILSTFVALPSKATENSADEKPFLRIAVASNFSNTLEQLIPDFTEQTGAVVEFSSGSTGMLFQQLSHGAPYDLFLAADVVRPKKLIELGLALPASRKTYAIGQLALWIKSSESTVQSWPQFVQWLASKPKNSKSSYHFAIANPAIAPYGKAAKQVLTTQNLWLALQPHLILGQNINQTFQQISTGAVDFGFIALSQAKQNKISVITLPNNAYSPIAQQLVILKNSPRKQYAELFSHYLLSAKVQNTLISQGYNPIVRPNNVQEVTNGF